MDEKSLMRMHIDGKMMHIEEVVEEGEIRRAGGGLQGCCCVATGQ